MGKNRLEAFSDGVIAIILTIMVLEMKVPHGQELASLLPVVPVAISYLLSFLLVAIYWNNHHHLLHLASAVNGLVLWANLHLLFWLSLVPFTTGWMGENHFAPIPVALYGSNMLMAGFAYFLLSRCLVRHHGAHSDLARIVRKDTKAVVSTVLYLLAIPVALWQPWVAVLLYFSIAALWLIPSRHIEQATNPSSQQHSSGKLS